MSEPDLRIGLKRIGFDEVEFDGLMNLLALGHGEDRLEKRKNFECFKNCDYHVILYRNAQSLETVKNGKIDIHLLSIRRHDCGTYIPWSDKFRIKNEVVGLQNDAIERYPPASSLINKENAYHLLVLADPNLRFPYSLNYAGNQVDARYIKPRILGGFCHGDGI